MDRLRTLLDLGALSHTSDDHGVSSVHVTTENNCRDELEEILRQDPRIEPGDTVFHYCQT